MKKVAFELFDDIKCAVNKKANSIRRSVEDEESSRETNRTENSSNMAYICFHFRKGSIQVSRNTEIYENKTYENKMLF